MLYTAAFQDGNYCPHSTDEETKPQRGKSLYQRSQAGRHCQDSDLRSLASESGLPAASLYVSLLLLLIFISTLRYDAHFIDEKLRVGSVHRLVQGYV